MAQNHLTPSASFGERAPGVSPATPFRYWLTERDGSQWRVLARVDQSDPWTLYATWTDEDIRRAGRDPDQVMAPSSGSLPDAPTPAVDVDAGSRCRRQGRGLRSKPEVDLDVR